MGATPFTVSWHESLDPDVVAAWHELDGLRPDGDPAHSLEYHRMIRTTFGGGAMDRFLIVHQGTRPCALLPVHVESRQLGPFRQRRVLGGLGWHGTTTEILASPDQALAAAAAAHESLAARTRGAALHFWRVPMESPLLRTAPPDAHVDAPVMDWTVRHRGEGSTLGGKDRREMQRLLRQLEATGEVTWERITDGPALADLVRLFPAMHTELKRAQRQRAVFADSPGADARFAEAWTSLCGEGKGAMCVLRHDGAPIAMLAELVGRTGTRAWRAARIPSLQRFGLGIAILDRAIRASRGRGESWYALGPGDEPYKRAWVRDPQPSYRLRIPPRGVQGLLQRLYGRLSGRAIT